MHTTSFWLTLEHDLLRSLPFTVAERQSGIFGLLYALRSMATLLLMCDRRDLGAAIGERAHRNGREIREGNLRARDLTQEIFEPNLYLYDAYPGGIGLSEPLYQLATQLWARVRELITACPCKTGCPSCVGPADEGRDRTKDAALAILECLCGPYKLQPE